MIFVTGGAGFIGSNFVLEWLAESDEAVLNLDCLSYAGNLDNLASLEGDTRHQFVYGTIADGDKVLALLRTHRPRAIVHFAAESHVDRSIASPGNFVSTNINGSFALLEAARSYWEALEGSAQAQFRFLHVSTDEVYGSLGPEEAPFTESRAYAPNSPYAASKAASDHLVRSYHHTYGLPTLTIHCSNNYGPRQFPEKLIPLMITNALAGKALPIYGDGMQVRDWLYVSDHCSAIRRVLADGIAGQVYNAGGRSEMSNLHVVHTVCDLLDQQAPRQGSYRAQIAHVDDRPGHDRRYAIDASKLERELGWKPAESFTSGIAKTVQWYLAHQAWVADIQSGAYQKRLPAKALKSQAST
jgi:dTDP-glucose 4,6-dehydratase